MLKGAHIDSVPAPFGGVLGLARTSLALATLVTLISETPEILFNPTREVGYPIEGGLGLAKWTLFIAIDDVAVARLVAIALLVLVASGFRPRWTGLLHWWVTYSFQIRCAIPDGSDQVATVLTFLLVPVTLCDPRIWHWTQFARASGAAEIVGARIAHYALAAIRVQVAVIYGHAGLGKLAVPEWANGTALYYFLSDPGIGLASPLREVWLDLSRHALVLCALTWAPIALEVLLLLALTGSQRYRRLLLAPGILFHFGNWVLFGLGSFFLAMTAALLLFLLPASASLRLRLPQGLWTATRAAGSDLARRLGTNPAVLDESKGT